MRELSDPFSNRNRLHLFEKVPIALNFEDHLLNLVPVPTFEENTVAPDINMLDSLPSSEDARAARSNRLLPQYGMRSRKYCEVRGQKVIVSFRRIDPADRSNILRLAKDREFVRHILIRRTKDYEFDIGTGDLVNRAHQRVKILATVDLPTTNQKEVVVADS